MADFIYDDQGACVARIINGEIFSEATKRRIATVRGGDIYDLNGNFVGHLQGAGVVRKVGNLTPEAFIKLLSEA